VKRILGELRAMQQVTRQPVETAGNP
jgi:hypothetical protein